MNIIVTGGYGTLGLRVSKKLVEEGHDVFIIDPQGSNGALPFENYGTFLCPRAGMLGPTIDNNEMQIDRVIHLGETLATDLHREPSIITTNLTESAHVLHTCLMENIQCIYPTWQFKPPIQTSLLSMTLHEKTRLPSYYSVANAAIKVVELPILIDLYMPGRNLFSLLTRVYNHITLGWGLIVQDYEYMDEITLNWSTTSIAAKRIVNTTLDSKGRSAESLPSASTIRATQKEIIETFLDVMDAPGVSLLRRKLDPVDIERCSHDGRIREWIADAINATADKQRKPAS